MTLLRFLETHWLGLVGYWLLILNGPALCCWLRGKLARTGVHPEEIEHRCSKLLFIVLYSAFIFLLVYVISLNNFLPSFLGEAL